MKQLTFQILIALLCSACLLACGRKTPPKTKEQVLQERLAEKLANWQAEVEKNCRERVLDSAIVIVDSTLIANARRNRDSETPLLPERPGKPPIVLPQDTTPVAPLLKKGDTIRN